MSRRVGYFSQALLLAVTLCLSGTLLAEENRLALVIGNSHYEESPLNNPQNDAHDMAAVLEDLGFTVMLHIDADRRDMARAIRDFGRELKEKRGVGLFYYAGHGMQIDNRNYLIPVDAPLEEEDEVPFESVDVGSVLAKMESAGNALNLLILDACRNNPFPSKFRSSSRSLARVEAPVGSLVVYSTAPGTVASDGEGRNGIFTGALLEQLRKGGMSLTQTIRRTRAAVVEATRGQQVPWESNSLLQDYYFTEPASPAPEPSSAVQSADKLTELELAPPINELIPTIDPDLLFWSSIQGSQSAAEYQAYLDQFPDGLFASLAIARVNNLNSQTNAVRSGEASSKPQTPPHLTQPSKPETPQSTPKPSAAAVSSTMPTHIPQASPDVTEVANEPPSQASSRPRPDTAAAANKNHRQTSQPNPEPPTVPTSTDAQTDVTPSTIQLARLETTTPPVKPDSHRNNVNRGKLTIEVTPVDARVRIMNIVDIYKPGIELDLKQAYDVLVTRDGYDSFRQSVTLDKIENLLSVTLNKRNALAPDSMTLAGGSFFMGCSLKDKLCEPYEMPRHEVSVSNFSITRTEITVAQFSQFVEATGYISDAEKNAGGMTGCYIWSEGAGISRTSAKWVWAKGKSWKDPGYTQTSSFPVTCVSWNDAQAYAKWLSQISGYQYALPTEAEWEFAARAGTTETAFGNGTNAKNVCKLGNIADLTQSPSGSKWSSRIPCNDRYWFSAPVSSYSPNASGLHDMQGNVWEWVEDGWAKNFKNTPRDGSAQRPASSKDRVLRGGAWESDAKRARLSSRNKAPALSRTSMTGFRLISR